MFTWYWLHTMRANDVRPYGLFGRVCCAAKSLRSLRIYVVLRDRKAVQVYASMLVLFDVWVLCAFWICSAPLSRLTPIEALPQAPLGALPPDPHNGFHPWTFCSLRSVLGHNSGQLCPFLNPHSSLFTPVFKLDKCLKKCYYTIVIKLICKFSVLSERK